MKNVFDVTKHQLTREVNFLVKMVINKNYSRDMIRQEIENRFNPISPAEKESIFFEILQKSYISAWLLSETILHRRSERDIEELDMGKEKMTENEVKDSYVIKLTDFLTGIINSNSFMVSRGNRLGEDFFSYCLHRSLNTEVFTEIDDIELFTIYLKQLQSFYVTAIYSGKQMALPVSFQILHTTKTYISPCFTHSGSRLNGRIYSHLFQMLQEN